MPNASKRRTKKLVRKVRDLLHGPQARLDLAQVEVILRSCLGLQAGDTVLVHSSFGMLNAVFAPARLIELLKQIVTPSGLIVMPYYPPASAVEWLERGYIFDHALTQSSMGVLTTVFKNDPETVVSIHPIKALAAWGDDAEALVKGHEHSVTPFDALSPYSRLKSRRGAKAIGLGIERCAFFHHCEDVLLPAGISSRYLSRQFTGLVRNKAGYTTRVNTLVHDPVVMGARELSCSYFRRQRCPSFVSVKVGICPFYIVSLPAMFGWLRELWTQPELETKSDDGSQGIRGSR